MLTTVVIWYVWYDNIILNILSHQFFNKNSIITRISVFVFVTVIINVLKTPKGIVLLIQFTSVITWAVFLLFTIFKNIVWYYYSFHPFNKGNICNLSQSCLWMTTSKKCWCCWFYPTLHSLCSWFYKIIVTCLRSVYRYMFMKCQYMCIRNTGEKRIPINGKYICQARYVTLNFIVIDFLTSTYHRNNMPIN